MPFLLSRPALAPHDGRSAAESILSNESYYSNQEIFILQDIVNAAQETLDTYPEGECLPTNALFRAYETVLPQHGIDPENDHHISRLLFRIGGERSHESLQDKFQAVLARMGIELEPATSPGTEHSASDEDETQTQDSLPIVQTRPQLHPREVRFADEVTAGLESLSLSDTSKTANIQPHPARLTSGVVPLPQLPPQAYSRPQDLPYSPVSPSAETDQSPRSPAQSVQSETHPESEDPTASSLDTQDHGAELDDAYLAVLEDRAAAFEEYVTASFGLRTFNAWHSISVILETQRDVFELHADATFRTRTLTTLVGDWKQYAEHLMEEKAKERAEAARLAASHRRLGKIASRAREIYVLTSTFATWQEHAAERAERTAVARRHMLRFRHFDSWKELAVSQEQLACSFVRSRYLSRWTARQHSLLKLDELAERTYQANLTRRTFRDWQLAQMDGLAESRHSRRLKEAAFSQWLSASRIINQTESVTTWTRERKVLEKTIRAWGILAKREEVLIDERVAFGQRQNLARNFRLWRDDTSQTMRDVEITYDIFLIEDVLKYWNLEAKCRNFRAEADHRLTTSLFRDWTAVQKMRSFQQQRDERQSQNMFLSFLSRARSLEAQGKDENIRNAAAYVHRPSTYTLFSTWHRIASVRRHTDAFANDQWTQKAKIDLLNDWYDLATEGPEMERWARRGQYYLATVTRMDDWRVWAKAEKERKLRETYATARSQFKQRMAERCWDTWSAACHRSARDMAKSISECESRSAVTRERCFVVWRERSAEDEMSEATSYAYSVESTVKRYLLPWRDLAESYADVDFDIWDDQSSTLITACLSTWYTVFRRVEGLAFSASNDIESKQTQRRDDLFGLWRGLVPTATSYAPGPPLSRSEAIPGGAAINRTRPSGMPWSVRSNVREYYGERRDRDTGASHGMGDVELMSVMSLNTPTRWTGPAGPIDTAPRTATFTTTTPIIPLNTPYERQLRARYGFVADTGPTPGSTPISQSIASQGRRQPGTAQGRTPRLTLLEAMRRERDQRVERDMEAEVEEEDEDQESQDERRTLD